MDHCEIEIEQPDDGDRTTLVFLAAAADPSPEPVADFRVPDIERANRIFSDAAVSADEAARYEHRRRVVAPVLMLLALGLLFAAGWSC